MEESNEIQLDDIRRQTVLGFFWEFFSKFLQYILNFATGVVLVRMLSPYDYGVIALTYIFVRIAAVLADGGLSKFLIQKKVVEDIDYSTVFIANILFAVILYSILYLLAPLVANFYNDDNLILLLRVISLNIFFQSLSMTRLTALHLNLNFKFLSITHIITIIISSVVAIILANLHFGYWTLVAFSLAQQIVAFMILSIFSKIHIKLQFSKSKFIELIKFSKSIVLLDILSAMSSDIYANIIGKEYSTSTVGIFNRAQQTHEYINIFTKISFGKVMYPVFRKIQDDLELVRDTIFRVFEITAFINLTILIVAAIFADEIFTVLYTSKWIEAAWMFQVLSFGAILAPLNYTLSYVLISIGLSQLYIKIEWYIKLLQLCLIPLFINSLQLILIGMVLLEIGQLIIRLLYYQKYIKIDTISIIKNLLPYLWLAIILIIVNLLSKHFIINMNIYLQLTIVSIVNCCVIMIYGKAKRLRPYSDIVSVANDIIVLIKVKLNLQK